MRRTPITAAAIAAVALLSFAPVNAQTASGTVNATPNVGAGANVDVGNTDVNAGANVSGGVSGSAQTGVTPSPGPSTDTDTSVSGKAQGSVDTPSASPKTGDEMDKDQESSKARGLDPDKKTGLDRADEAAGAHGQQGRDNARKKQSR